jgi:hypothetical protein
MAKKYPFVAVDSDGWSEELELPIILGCCTCSMVHDVKGRVLDGDKIVIQLKQNVRATAQRKRHSGKKE